MNKPYKNTQENKPERCITPSMQYTIGKKIEPVLLSDDAKEITETFGKEYHLVNGQAQPKPLKDIDKPTQLRKFYDEVVKLHDRCQQYNRDEKDGFKEVEVYVHMLPAKSAYAEGRGHVSFNFDYFIKTGVKQITCAESLHNFKLLFESVLGFYKQMRPQN